MKEIFDKERKNSSHLGFIKRNKLPLPDLEEYYRNRRYEKYKADYPIKGIAIRRVLHFPIIVILKLWHSVCSVKCNVIYNHSGHHKGPTIYVATHICWDDIEYVIDAITEHAYLFREDPKNLYRTFDGAFLDINGCVICDTEYKIDRFVAKETSIKVLNAGENLLLFPEGVWNTSENRLVNFLFPGIAEIAIRTNSDIVPIAIERAKKRFDVAIGKPIKVKNYTFDNKWELIQVIRNEMATLKWDIMEASGVYKRTEIPDNYSEIFMNDIFEDARGIANWIGFKEQEFHPRDIVEKEDVFEFLNKLNVNKNNAFLIRDNLTKEC